MRVQELWKGEMWWYVQIEGIEYCTCWDVRTDRATIIRRIIELGGKL